MVHKDSGIAETADPVEQFIRVGRGGFPGGVEIVELFEAHQILHPDNQFTPESVRSITFGKAAGLFQKRAQIRLGDPAQE